MHRDRVEHALERLCATHLAAIGRRFRHAVEHLEEVAVRALVLVDRHRTGRLAASSKGGTLALAVARRLLLVCALALLAAPAAWSHAIVTETDPPNGSVLASSPRAATVTFDDPVRVGSRNAAIRNDGVET